MKNTLFALMACLLVLNACQTKEKNTTDIFTKVYTTENLPTQGYTIDAGKDTVLTGAQGTKLHIAKNTFVNANGQVVSGPVTIELKEALNPIDMVMGNLTTVTNGEFLQTGGMLYINTTANNEQLSIAPDKSIGATVPGDTILDGDVYIRRG